MPAPGVGARQPPPALSSCPAAQWGGQGQIAENRPGFFAEIAQINLYLVFAF